MRYAVVGKGIDYSLSPVIHNFHFNYLNIDATYELLNVNDLKSNMSELNKLSGFNVTIPFKEEIISLCTDLSEEAKSINAVNCVKVSDNKLFGYNTDVYGFYHLLKKNHLLKTNKEVLIIGAGGAAKACFYYIKNYTNWKPFVSNRTINKAYLLTNDVIDFNEVNDHICKFDLIINCTNVGVKTYQSPIDIKEIKQGACFIDINYQSKNCFLDNAKKLNAKTINGLDMLIYQAKKSFEIWFDQNAFPEVMYQSIRKG